MALKSISEIIQHIEKQHAIARYICREQANLADYCFLHFVGVFGAKNTSWRCTRKAHQWAGLTNLT
jgi:hypothetical protein